MKLYNTLTKQKEEFESIEEGKIKMYVCGPTVYNYIHIGNARPYIIFDVARRFFESKGYEVTYVQNFTDVDDKIITKAKEEGVTPREIADKYIEEVLIDAKGLGVRKATIHPKATEEIDTMIDMIKQLIEKGYAYDKNGTVYYSTKKFKEYGKLSKKNIEDLEAGARIAVNTEKEDPMDFVLWKPKKEGEIAWNSPWGEGRPGWHIECSAMAKKYLGDTIDIHAGGVDLIFPHHENEIAQSEAANEKPFANYWLHNEFLNVDNKKMSKSKGNFFTVRDISKEYPYEVIRFFMLSAHYRSPINFSRELVDSSKRGLDRIKLGAKHLSELIDQTTVLKMTEDEVKLIKDLEKFDDKFDAALSDDINTADALSVVFEVIRYANINTNEISSREWMMHIKLLLESLCDILGIDISVKEEILDEEVQALIDKRQQARKDRDFALSDQIRDDLKVQGIILEDTREGVKFRRV